MAGIGEPFFLHTNNSNVASALIHPSLRLAVQTAVRAVETWIYLGVLLIPALAAIPFRRLRTPAMLLVPVAVIPAALVIRTGRDIRAFSSILWDIGLNWWLSRAIWPAAPPAFDCFVGRRHRRRSDGDARRRSSGFRMIRSGGCEVPPAFVVVLCACAACSSRSGSFMTSTAISAAVPVRVRDGDDGD
jgi:hypothetical protein